MIVNIVHLLCLLLLLSPAALASDLTEIDNIFISEVTSACSKRDTAAFLSLYCESGKNNNPPPFFSQPEVVFGRAYLDSPKKNMFVGVQHDMILSLCFETPTSKGMCQILPVRVSKGKRCIESANQAL